MSELQFEPELPEMALRLGKLFGNGPELWLRMQQDYDLARARETLVDAIEKIEPVKAVAA